MIDQTNIVTDMSLDNLEFQQQVTAGAAGGLAGVELFSSGYCCDPFCSNPCGPKVTVKIGLGPAFFTGSYAFTTTVALPLFVGTFIDTSAAGINLTPGEKFVIDVSAGTPLLNVAAMDSAYPGGDLWLGNRYPYDLTGYVGLPGIVPQSMAFETFVSTTTPEPSSSWLVFVGLGTVGAFGFKRVPAALRRRRAVR
ncbi:MAG: PEP-CTERM sorting domain-containing protein [Bryobacteraceae bacterium]